MQVVHMASPLSVGLKVAPETGKAAREIMHLLSRYICAAYIGYLRSKYNIYYDEDNCVCLEY